jgi:hypothetical protein
MNDQLELAPLPIEVVPYKTDDKSIPGYTHHQWIYRFPNGFGASVVQGNHTYGGGEGFYELAVIQFDCPSGVWSGDDQWGLTYETPVTDDVLGWLSIEDVAATLVKIAGLS